MIKKLLYLSPAPLVAVLQEWLNLFRVVYIAHPAWEASMGTAAVGAGAVTVLPVFALWDKMRISDRRSYIRSAIRAFAGALVLCWICSFIFATFRLPSYEVYSVIYYVWIAGYMIFGISISHMLAGYAFSGAPKQTAAAQPEKKRPVGGP